MATHLLLTMNNLLLVSSRWDFLWLCYFISMVSVDMNAIGRFGDYLHRGSPSLWQVNVVC